MRAALIACFLIPVAACLKADERQRDSAVLDFGDGGGDLGSGPGDGTDDGGTDDGGTDDGGTDDGGTDDGGTGDGGTGDGGTDGGEDADGDGFSYADGDCDDRDPDINPWADDDNCDGVDDDCDDRVDEASSVSDPYEGEEDVWLGDLTSKGGAYADPFIFPDDDIDSFQFFLDEGFFDDFYFDVELIAPSGSDLGMEIYFFSEDWDPATDSFELLETVDDAGAGGVEFYANDGGIWDNNGGWYGILVWANNRGSCEDPYELTVTVD